MIATARAGSSRASRLSRDFRHVILGLPRGASRRLDDRSPNHVLGQALTVSARPAAFGEPVGDAECRDVGAVQLRTPLSRLGALLRWVLGLVAAVFVLSLASAALTASLAAASTGEPIDAPDRSESRTSRGESDESDGSSRDTGTYGNSGGNDTRGRDNSATNHPADASANNRWPNRTGQGRQRPDTTSADDVGRTRRPPVVSVRTP